MSAYDKETGILFDGKYSLDKSLIKTICETFHPVKIVDMGCGRGDYCKVCLSYGYEVDGLEGSQIACQKAVCSNIECVDLSKPAEPRDDYDLVLCLEVGEHIPDKHQNVFIDNLARFSKDILILSWALPGQGGTGHVNCLSNETVIELMKNKGFNFDKHMSEYLRKNSKLSWFKNTLMVFKREKE
jgi:SAM-dependent methyltransferase